MSELISANALLVANLLLLGAAAIELLRVRRIVARHRRAAPESAPALPKRAPAQPARTAAEDAGFLSALDERILALRQVAGELARAEPAATRTERYDSSFDDAVRLARRGAQAAELTLSCGLNRGEAELMQRLYAAPARLHDGRSATG